MKREIDQRLFRERDLAQKIEIWSFVSRCLKAWYWFVIVCAISIALGWFYLQKTNAVYQVSGKILIQEDKNTEKIGSATFGINSPFLSENLLLVNEMEVLRSSRLMQKVVEELTLNVGYFLEKRFVFEELYGEYPVEMNFGDSLKYFYGMSFDLLQLDPTNLEIIVSTYSATERKYLPQDTLQTSYGTRNYFKGRSFNFTKHSDFNGHLIINVEDAKAVARSYANKIEIDPVPEGEVLNISIQDHIPEKSKAIIESLIQAYNQDVLENKNESTNKTIDFIDRRLSLITTELFDIEKELEDFKRENELPVQISQSAQQFLDKITINDQAISELELQENLLALIEKELNQSASNNTLPAVDFNIEGGKPEIIDDYNQLINERSRLLLSATPNNPQVIAIDKRLSDIRSDIVDWVDFKQDQIEQQKEFLIRRSDPINSKIASVPKYEREMLQIMRQQVIKETLFTFLLQRREESAMTLAAEVNNARFINDPVLVAHISPKKKFIYVIFLFAGIAIPASVILLIEYFDNNIYDEEDLAKYTRAPFLGGIPNEKISNKLLVDRGVRSVIAETFRLVRTNLQYLCKGQFPKVIMVTSSSGGEGKTFISINLASSLAISGKSVVIVGMDLRKPKVAQYLNGSGSRNGVTNFLIGQVKEVEEIVNKVEEVENLYYVDSGPIPPNPNELMLGENTEKLIEELKAKFDFVVVDTSPVGLVSDALSLKEFVDATLYITKFEYTKKGQLAIIEDIYANEKLPNPAVVLNGIKKRIGSRYGRYNGYAYAYGYGYYEGDNPGFFKRFMNKFKKS